MHAGSVSHTPMCLSQGLQENLRVCRVGVGVGVGEVWSEHPSTLVQRAVSGRAVRPAGQARSSPPNLPLSPLISSFLLLSVCRTADQLFPPLF